MGERAESGVSTKRGDDLFSNKNQKCSKRYPWSDKTQRKQTQINSTFLFPFSMSFEKISQMWLATEKKKVKPFGRVVPKSWLQYFDLWIMTDIKVLLVL